MLVEHFVNNLRSRISFIVFNFNFPIQWKINENFITENKFYQCQKLILKIVEPNFISITIVSLFHKMSKEVKKTIEKSRT